MATAAKPSLTLKLLLLMLMNQWISSSLTSSAARSSPASTLSEVQAVVPKVMPKAATTQPPHYPMAASGGKDTHHANSTLSRHIQQLGGLHFPGQGLDGAEEDASFGRRLQQLLCLTGGPPGCCALTGICRDNTCSGNGMTRVRQSVSPCCDPNK